ncbi:hypothetical protein BMI90_18435 [Thioclava sp. L04-15]|uniref:hypothetical protein n=1 Tax=Thioclava sp. L04-15 TaxID=1915318 RepID=UPI000996EAE0|nr:hypothetical protein [Thioclava sp. L04-15]OOY26320.1 hypothetical protein BMI90_18435 [Thioclava sp. L04-15]
MTTKAEREEALRKLPEDEAAEIRAAIAKELAGGPSHEEREAVYASLSPEDAAALRRQYEEQMEQMASLVFLGEMAKRERSIEGTPWPTF